ncbi:hypothetical protein QBC44DRAFT_363706 [Cladorrhinum sp. PSN332]|nr:hypothetical protein QBC44DRAFT_363706 [Cladorrhinum sp. PSN332]
MAVDLAIKTLRERSERFLPLNSCSRATRLCQHHQAIRGGDQQPAPGCANVGPGGITVDLSLLNCVKFTGDGAVLAIGAGARWGQVYDKPDGTGLAVTGARSSAGGIGGLSLTGKFPCLYYVIK